MSQCTFTKQNGLQCEANAISDADLCFTHNPETHEAKMVAVTKGGLNRKHYESYGEALTLEHPSDIKRLLAETINGVWTGKIPSNQPANTIGFLARCWIDIHQTLEYEERMEALEEKLQKMKV
jgi:hypothetical protein